MATFRVHRLKDHLRQQFRFAPHVSGTAVIKPRDYEPDLEVEATSPYAAYFALRDSGAPLVVGDVLECSATLSIFKFVGFEEARWVEPELKGAQAEAVRPDAPPEQAAALQ
jgi:hypothetical protein